VGVETTLCDEPSIPVEVKEGLYRIALEALHNTVRHAQATTVRLSLLHVAQRYCLEIADDGQGFDALQSFPGHLGLKSMRERTSSLGGDFQIESAPGKGTRITVSIGPLGGEPD
jgi:signal transduction histidine kinase